jgi:hypothetical protein
MLLLRLQGACPILRWLHNLLLQSLPCTVNNTGYSLLCRCRCFFCLAENSLSTSSSLLQQTCVFLIINDLLLLLLLSGLVGHLHLLRCFDRPPC